MKRKMEYKVFKRTACLCVFATLTFTIFSCEKEEADPGALSIDGEQKGEVLAQVNETKIFAHELEYARERLRGNALHNADSKLNEKILDSLIASRAMSLLAENELDEQDKMLLDVKAKAYKEELLVKEYINRYASPEPVTTAMVKAYYDENPREFGGDTIKRFEFVSSYGVLDESQRNALAEAFSGIGDDENLQGLSEALSKKTFNVRYKKAEMRTSIIQSPLKELVEKTEVGKLAPLHNGTKMILLRVTSERTSPPKPLAEVSADIRKRLSPLQLKKAMTILVDEATKKVRVEKTKIPND